MGVFTASVFVTRPAQAVFDFLSDPANLSRWNSSFQSAQWSSSEPPGVGSTYDVVAKMLGAGKQGTFEIVEWDAPHRYGYRSNQRVFPIERMQTFLTIDPEGGGTRVTMSGQFALVGILRFAEGIFARLAAKQDGDNLVAAKRLLETEEQPRPRRGSRARLGHRTTLRSVRRDSPMDPLPGHPEEWDRLSRVGP